MSDQKFTQWLERVFATTDEELLCTDVQSILPAYVEAQLLDKEALDERPFAGLHAHLVQCPDCQEVFRGVYTVLEIEMESGLPSVDELLAAFEPYTQESDEYHAEHAVPQAAD